MLSKWQFNLLTWLGAIALLLVLTNAVTFSQNRALQTSLSQRQQFVQQSVSLEALYRDMVKTLAESAVKGNDRQVLDMLAAQGINVTVNPTGTAPAANDLERK